MKTLKDNLVLTFQIWVFIKGFDYIESFIMGVL